MNTVNNDGGGEHGIKLILRALRSRNYKLFFFGQGISLIGTWMQQVTIGWLVYRLTGSTVFLGVVSGSSTIFTFLFAPYAGVIADKFNRHRILFITQTLAMIQAFILAFLTITNRIEDWHFIVLSIFMGIINAFDMPTRQAFVYELVDDEDDLPNAIALNSMIFNGARFIGPTIAGVIIASFNESVCFFINAVSFIAVLISLALIRISPQKKYTKHNGTVMTGLKDGLSYTSKSIPIRTILLLLSLISLLVMPYSVLMPIFAKDILGGTSLTYGFLMAAVGVGALAGAVFLASRRTVQGLDSLILIAICILGSSLIVFSFSRYILLSIVMMLFAGFGVMVQMASANTVLQSIVDDDKRGRVMSFYTMSFMGTAFIGSILGGSIAHFITAPYTILISGTCCLAAALLFSRKLTQIKNLIHPIYVRKGIIPQVASGIGTAATLTAETKE